MEVIQLERVQRNPITKKQRKVVKARRIAEAWGKSPATISLWMHRKHDPLPYAKVNGIIEIDVELAEEWRERNTIRNY